MSAGLGVAGRDSTRAKAKRAWLPGATLAALAPDESTARDPVAGDAGSALRAIVETAAKAVPLTAADVVQRPRRAASTTVAQPPLARLDQAQAAAASEPAAELEIEPATACEAAPPAAPNTRAAADQLLALMHEVQTQHCQHAFQRVHALTKARLFSVIFRINRDRAESEDLLQDVFVKIWQQRSRFDSQQGELGGWLSAIAHNTAISSLRSRHCRPQAAGALHAHGLEDLADQPCGNAGPAAATAERQTRDAVRRSLAQLPVEQRDGLALAFFEGLSHQEIAQRVGRPLGTVKSSLRRALLALRPALQAHRGDLQAG